MCAARFLLATLSTIFVIVVSAASELRSSGLPARKLVACSGRKGVVYDFFNQYCPSVTLTNSDWFINFDAGYDTACTDPSVIAKHQPMIWGSDRIQSGYNTIKARPSYAKPSYLLTFNEPNYAYGGGTPTNINSPQQAAALWPYIVGNFSSLGIALLAPSAINCAYPSDANCRYVGSITGWLNAFKAAIGTTAWNNIHGLSYHTYQTSLSGITNDLNSLYSTYGKPIWVTEIADGSGSSMAANQQLMIEFVTWAASRSWIERVFWNQATPSSNGDANVLNSYLKLPAALKKLRVDWLKHLLRKVQAPQRRPRQGLKDRLFLHNSQNSALYQHGWLYLDGLFGDVIAEGFNMKGFFWLEKTRQCGKDQSCH
ncbi:hypothetical protein WJX77_008033 [Trebouxia sp. C0004]